MSSMVRSSARRLVAIVHGARRLMPSASLNALFSHSFSRIERVGDITREMGEAGLVRVGMTLLGSIAVGAPDVVIFPRFDGHQ